MYETPRSQRNARNGGADRRENGEHADLADAKAKGVKFGRKPTLTPHQQKEARKRLEAGETQRSVARSYNVSQSTISRL
jgi:DNA invertase Pin-like site-specific DNA recombinase